jgi:hypothetical protein
LIALSEMNRRHQREAMELLREMADVLGIKLEEWRFDPQNARFVRAA